MKISAMLEKTYQSYFRGAFLSATAVAFVGAFIGFSFYVIETYDNYFNSILRFYLSRNGFQWGVLIPIYIGGLTATLGRGLKICSKSFSSKFLIRYFSYALSLSTYLLIAFIGSLIIIYLTN
jgi:hypothetical protein